MLITTEKDIHNRQKDTGITVINLYKVSIIKSIK